MPVGRKNPNANAAQIFTSNVERANIRYLRNANTEIQI
jgi:hypothetical protein